MFLQAEGGIRDVVLTGVQSCAVAVYVLGVFAAARDVTAQKQASQYARSLIEASLDPLVTISPDGKITEVSTAPVRTTGTPRERMPASALHNKFTEPAKGLEAYQRRVPPGLCV